MSDKSGEASRYAQAILEAMVERWQDALEQFGAGLAAQPQVAERLTKASVPAPEKLAALETVLPVDLPAELANLLKLLAQDGRFDLLPEVMAALSKVATGRSGPVKAEVISAVELRTDEQEQLRGHLTAQYGPELVFSFQVDPTLLGGLRVRVGDQLMDMSVVSRLNALRESLRTVVR